MCFIQSLLKRNLQIHSTRYFWILLKTFRSKFDCMIFVILPYTNWRMNAIDISRYHLFLSVIASKFIHQTATESARGHSILHANLKLISI